MKKLKQYLPDNITPYPFLLLILLIKIIQSNFVSYDGFIGGPHTILLKECESCLLDYFYNNSIQPLYLLIYFLIDLTFIGIFYWTLIHIFKEYCWSEDMDKKILKTLLFIVCILFCCNIIWNYLAYNFYEINLQKIELGKYTDDLIQNLKNYRKTYDYQSFTLLIPLLYTLWFYFLHQLRLKQKKYQNPGKIFDEEDSAKDIFWKVIGSFTVTILLGFLLAIVDQGPMLVYNLVEKSTQLFIALFLFLIISWMALFNPYYVNHKLYYNNKFAITEKAKVPYFFIKSFNWSNLKTATNKDVNYLLHETNSNVAFWQRISVIAPTWLVIFVLCSLWIRVIKLQPCYLVLAFCIFPASVILSLFIFKKFSKLVILNENYELTQSNQGLIREGKHNTCIFVSKMNLLMIIFTISLTVAIIISTLLFFNPLDNSVQQKLILAIILMFQLNIILSIFLIVRRKLSFFEETNPIFFKCFSWVGKDRYGRISQFLCSIIILGMAFFLYYQKPDWVYHINPIIIVFAFIIITFFFFQSIAAFKTKLIFSELLKKFELYFHAFLRLSLVFIFSMQIYSTIINDPQYHEIPLVDKYENSAAPVEKIKLVEHIIKLDTSAHHYYMIANEGGGLRANLWSLLVLNQLDSLSNGEFYNNVIATCGASGGAIGQGLHHLMKENNPNLETNEKNIIHKIARTGFLSRDMFSLLFERQFALLDPRERKRYISRKESKLRGDMIQANKYAALAHQKDLDTVLNEEHSFHQSIEKWWYQARKNSKYKSNHFPLPIIHATNIETGMEGVVCPIDDAAAIFNGVHIINDSNLKDHSCKSDQKQKSISYIDALFLTNRFPLMSPIANIPGKGNYNDSGVFDNTGISSLLDIMIYLEMKASEEIIKNISPKTKDSYQSAFQKIKNNTTLIIIQNSQESFARNHFKKWNGKINRLKSYENLRSNLKSATSTSAVKDFLQNVAEKKIGTYFHDVVTINLPYLILDKQNADAIFNGQLKCDEMVWKDLKNFNKDKFQLHELDKKFYFKAPLGRLVNNTVYKFMKTEVNSQPMLLKLDQILNPLKLDNINNEAPNLTKTKVSKSLPPKK